MSVQVLEWLQLQLGYFFTTTVLKGGLTLRGKQYRIIFSCSGYYFTYFLLFSLFYKVNAEVVVWQTLILVHFWAKVAVVVLARLTVG